MRSDRLKRLRNRWLRRVLELGQRVRVDVLPRHFYSSIPDLRALRASPGWRAPRSMVAVDGVEIDAQLAFAAACCADDVRTELGGRDVYDTACRANGAVGFGPVEADFLFGFVATQRPRRVIQVGAGVSTAVILAAAEHAGYDIEVRCVDPYPTAYLQRAAATSRLELVREGAEAVDLSALTDVGDGDLFFVDSTHTVRPGGEVNRIVHEVLPRLAPGTFAHFHDIFFPYDYQRDLLGDGVFFWSETALLQAFLEQNEHWSLAVSLSMLHYACPERLQALLPRYRPQPDDDGLVTSGADGHFPSSTYLRAR